MIEKLPIIYLQSFVTWSIIQQLEVWRLKILGIWSSLDFRECTCLQSNDRKGNTFKTPELDQLLFSVSDQGRYDCHVESGDEVLEHSVQVSVVTVPRVDQVNSVTTVAGQYSVALHCQAHGIPRPSITWSKKQSEWVVIKMSKCLKISFIYNFSASSPPQCFEL